MLRSAALSLADLQGGTGERERDRDQCGHREEKEGEINVGTEEKAGEREMQGSTWGQWARSGDTREVKGVQRGDTQRRRDRERERSMWRTQGS